MNHTPNGTSDPYSSANSGGGAFPRIFADQLDGVASDGEPCNITYAFPPVNITKNYKEHKANVLDSTGLMKKAL